MEQSILATYELALINPRRKKGRKSATRKRRATRGKSVKRNSKGRFVKKAASTRKRRRHNPRVARRVKRRKHVARAAAPVRRRRRRHVMASGTRRVRRRRHNPRFNVSGITSQLVPAAFGAGGGLLLDIAVGYLPLPDTLKTGYPKHGVKIAGALALGFLTTKFVKGEKGRAMAAGALTTALYALGKELLAKFAPSLPGLAGGLDDYHDMTLSSYLDPAPHISGGMDGMGAYLSGPEIEEAMSEESTDGVGAYLTL